MRERREGGREREEGWEVEGSERRGGKWKGARGGVGVLEAESKEEKTVGGRGHQ